ncbi:MAG TPA: hypothetical protein VE690_02895 [Rhodopila sp.]|nr:hypothetical protein [Rhodopila sp.]
MTSDASGPPQREWTRRLSDKLRLTFHTACDEADYTVAEHLLNTLCKHTVKPSVVPAEGDRRKREDLSGACERLANLLLWRAEAGKAPETGRAETGEAEAGGEDEDQA